MADLKTDYKDDVLDTEVNELRKYQMIQNEDGTVSFVDVTEYLQVGDSFGSADVNDITLALSVRNLETYTNVAQLGLTQDNTLEEIFSAMTVHSQLVAIISQGKNLNDSLPSTDTSELIVTKSHGGRAAAILIPFQTGKIQTNSRYNNAWTGWETLATQTELDTKLANVGATLQSATPTQGSVANGGDILTLTIPKGGKWIITGYAGGQKVLLKTDNGDVWKHGVNPLVYASTSSGAITIKMANASGAQQTIYADASQYYITAIRIG